MPVTLDKDLFGLLSAAGYFSQDRFIPATKIAATLAASTIDGKPIPRERITAFMSQLRMDPDYRRMVRWEGELPQYRFSQSEWREMADMAMENLRESPEGSFFRSFMDAAGINAGRVGDQLIAEVATHLFKAGAFVMVPASETEAPSVTPVILPPETPKLIPGKLLPIRFINTIPVEEQPAYPGDLGLERRILNIDRWNAAMEVTWANIANEGLGGHIATYQSEAEYIHVAETYFIRSRDIVADHGHAKPGRDARDALRKRIDRSRLFLFRQDTKPDGITSYFHPWIEPDRHTIATVSMGLGPIFSIVAASTSKYFHNRGLADTSDMHVWGIFGDGEMDEPESRGAFQLAYREKLGNFTGAIICNRQRLDSPVRANGNIVQELASFLIGAGIRPIVVQWGSGWDPYFARDPQGFLEKRMQELPDTQWQSYYRPDWSGERLRAHFGSKPNDNPRIYPAELTALLKPFSDEDLKAIFLDVTVNDDGVFQRGSSWENLFAQDTEELLKQRISEIPVDSWSKFSNWSGAQLRAFVAEGRVPEDKFTNSFLQKMPDDQLKAAFNEVQIADDTVYLGETWQNILQQEDGKGFIRYRLASIPVPLWSSMSQWTGEQIRLYLTKGRIPDENLLAFFTELDGNQLKALFEDVGGHDMVKLYAAFDLAMKSPDIPTVILPVTIKGRGMKVFQAAMATHNRKYLEYDEIVELAKTLEIPVSIPDVSADEKKKMKSAKELQKARNELLKKWDPFYFPSDDDPIYAYMEQKEKALGGTHSKRRTEVINPMTLPEAGYFQKMGFEDSTAGSIVVDGKTKKVETTAEFIPILVEGLRTGKLPANVKGAKTPVSSTQVLVDILKALKSHKFGPRRGLTVLDEARTFGLDEELKDVYDPLGKLYDLLDDNSETAYLTGSKSSLFEDGIAEAIGLARFISLGIAYATHGTPMVPFLLTYSMFGLQRTMDQWWQAADMRARGFIFGLTYGKTTLTEGTQHADGHSQALASTIPNLQPYDLTFSYEYAVMIEEGMRRMYGGKEAAVAKPGEQVNEDIFYYLTGQNENMLHAPMPKYEGTRENIAKGLYLFSKAEEIYKDLPEDAPTIDLLTSSSVYQNAVLAQEQAAKKYGIKINIYMMPSPTLLRREALEVERWNLLHPDEEPRVPFVTKMLSNGNPIVTVTDTMKLVADQIRPWIPGSMYTLGTDGFGRSDTRHAMRDWFEVSEKNVLFTVLKAAAEAGKFDPNKLIEAQRDLNILPNKPDSATADPVDLGRQTVQTQALHAIREYLRVPLLNDRKFAHMSNDQTRLRKKELLDKLDGLLKEGELTPAVYQELNELLDKLITMADRKDRRLISRTMGALQLHWLSQITNHFQNPPAQVLSDEERKEMQELTQYATSRIALPVAQAERLSALVEKMLEEARSNGTPEITSDFSKAIQGLLFLVQDNPENKEQLQVLINRAGAVLRNEIGDESLPLDPLAEVDEEKAADDRFISQFPETNSWSVLNRLGARKGLAPVDYEAELYRNGITFYDGQQLGTMFSQEVRMPFEPAAARVMLRSLGLSEVQIENALLGDFNNKFSGLQAPEGARQEVITDGVIESLTELKTKLKDPKTFTNNLPGNFFSKFLLDWPLLRAALGQKWPLSEKGKAQAEKLLAECQTLFLKLLLPEAAGVTPPMAVNLWDHLFKYTVDYLFRPHMNPETPDHAFEAAVGVTKHLHQNDFRALEAPAAPSSESVEGIAAPSAPQTAGVEAETTPMDPATKPPQAFSKIFAGDLPRAPLVRGGVAVETQPGSRKQLTRSHILFSAMGRLGYADVAHTLKTGRQHWTPAQWRQFATAVSRSDRGTQLRLLSQMRGVKTATAFSGPSSIFSLRSTSVTTLAQKTMLIR